jgi:hypothetical protein
MSYGDIESDMYSIALHAVAKGYGKIEYFLAHPMARSSRVTTTASVRSDASSEVARRGRTVEIGFAMRRAIHAAAIADPALQRRVLAKGLRPYNVLTFAALLAALATGWSAVTDLKSLLGAGYGQLLWLLAGKLLSFGLAHRLVRAEVGDLPLEPDKQRAMIGRMHVAAWLAVAVTVWISWMGLRLTDRLRAAPPPVPAPRVAS